MNFDRVDVVEQMILLGIIFITCLIGSYTRDMLDTLKGLNLKINKVKILVCSATTSILLWSLSEMVTKKYPFKTIIAISIISGLLSYDIVTRLSNFTFVKDLISRFNRKT